MQLHELSAPKGAKKRRKIVGRGQGSGHGKTSCRGENGQGSREGRGIIGALEGGQMPLVRRIAKVGFRSKRPIIYQVVNLESLNRFEKDSIIDAELLRSKGLIKRVNKPFKVLAKGELKKALTLRVETISKSAQEKVEKAGGKIELVDNKKDEAKE